VDELGAAVTTRGVYTAEHLERWCATESGDRGSSGARRAMMQGLGAQGRGALTPFWSSGAPIATPAGASDAVRTTWSSCDIIPWIGSGPWVSRLGRVRS
jgi:hypothetical protein